MRSIDMLRLGMRRLGALLLHSMQIAAAAEVLAVTYKHHSPNRSIAAELRNDT